MSEYIDKVVKVINTDGFQFQDSNELEMYIGKIGIIKIDHNYGFRNRFIVEFYDKNVNDIDNQKGKICFAIDNLEFIGKNEEKDKEDVNDNTLPDDNINKNNLQDIIKQMLNVIGDYEGSKISMGIWPPNEIYFLVYETEALIEIDKKEKCAYLNTDTMTHHLTASMLDELCQIVKIIDDNIDVILECL